MPQNDIHSLKELPGAFTLQKGSFNTTVEKSKQRLNSELQRYEEVEIGNEVYFIDTADEIHIILKTDKGLGVLTLHTDWHGASYDRPADFNLIENENIDPDDIEKLRQAMRTNNDEKIDDILFKISLERNGTWSKAHFIKALLMLFPDNVITSLYISKLQANNIEPNGVWNRVVKRAINY